MSELWGFAAGQHARREQDSRMALADLALRKGNIEVAQSEVALRGSEVALQAQEKMIELMRQRSANRRDSEAGTTQIPGASATEMNDIPSALEEMANLAIESGLPQQASEFAAKASTIRNNASEIRKRTLDERVANLTLASNLLSTVNDERSWQQANALYAMTTGQQSPFAQMQFSPALVAKIRDSVISEKDRAATDASNARAEAARAATAESSIRQNLYKAQTRLTDARTAAVQKVGGKQPKAEDVRAVTDLIVGEFGGAVLPEDARVLARPIAERASQLIAQDDLPRSQAVQRAFNEAMANGDFAGIRPRTQMRGNVRNPLDMPASQEELRPNMVYKLGGKHQGKLGVWSGTGFTVIDPAKVTTSTRVSSEAELDDDAEEGFDNEHTENVDEGY